MVQQSCAECSFNIFFLVVAGVEGHHVWSWRGVYVRPGMFLTVCSKSHNPTPPSNSGPLKGLKIVSKVFLIAKYSASQYSRDQTTIETGILVCQATAQGYHRPWKNYLCKIRTFIVDHCFLLKFQKKKLTNGATVVKAQS